MGKDMSKQEIEEAAQRFAEQAKKDAKTLSDKIREVYDATVEHFFPSDQQAAIAVVEMSEHSIPDGSSTVLADFIEEDSIHEFSEKGKVDSKGNPLFDPSAPEFCSEMKIGHHGRNEL